MGINNAGGMAQSFVPFRYECYFKTARAIAMHFYRIISRRCVIEEERILLHLEGGEDRVEGVKKKRGGGGNKSRSNSKAVRNYRGPSRRSQEGNDERWGRGKARRMAQGIYCL